ncbi:MAG: hypothetical protein AB7H90_22785 [Alphaproteobacteria bacterium]
MRNRDTRTHPRGTEPIETFHQGFGMTPLAYVGPANRKYYDTGFGIRRMLDRAQNDHAPDATKWHCTGESMRAMGCVNQGLHGLFRDQPFAALQSARRGYVFVFDMGNHDTGIAAGAFDCDAAAPDLGVCYNRSWFRTGLTYLAFSNSSTGPNDGPHATMTVDVTMRRLQQFIKANGATANCTVIPDNESSVAKSGTVVGNNGVFTLTGVTINASGATSVLCN